MSDIPMSSCEFRTSLVSYDDIKDILLHFSKASYRAKDDDVIAGNAMLKCIEITRVDYSALLINNANGELSPNYPSQLIILEYELQNAGSGASVAAAAAATAAHRTTNTIYESLYDVHKLRDLINKARYARCRARFPLPVILYKGKYICRSATLSGGPEIYGRSGLDYLFYGSDTCDSNMDNVEGEEEGGGANSGASTPLVSQSDWQLFDRVRSQDIKLLKTLNVGTIVDFMVEKKKVKFGVNVTSSEKVDKENRYSDFTLISLPYPGCEFFRDYRDNNYVAEGLVFDWSQAHVDAHISIPEMDEGHTNATPIDWPHYKDWDLVQITQNYMRLLLRYLQEQSSGAGLLIHCISGWDRTPLFVSLLRLSLWADGVIHQNLDAQEILYLTVAYDWMMFGHKLAERLAKGEEIFFFCFYMLKHLVGDEFSALPSRLKTKVGASGATDTPPKAPVGVPVTRTDSDLHLDGIIMLENESQDPLECGGSNISLNSSCSSVSSKSQEQTAIWFHPGMEESYFSNGNPPILSNISVELGSTGSGSGSISSAASVGSGAGSVGCRSPQTQARRTSPVMVPSSSISMSSAASSRLRTKANAAGAEQQQQQAQQPLAQQLRHDSAASLSVGSWQMITGTGTGSLRTSADSFTGNGHVNGAAQGNLNANTGSIPGSHDSNCTLVDDERTSLAHNSDAYAIRKMRLLKVREIFYSCYHSTIGFKFKNEASLGAIFGNLAENFGFSAARP